MIGVARLNDVTHGTCYAHDSPIQVSGKIISASTDTLLESRGIARLGDTVRASCGHTGKIVSASPNVICNGMGVARLGDSTHGNYIAKIVSASTTSFVNIINVDSVTDELLYQQGIASPVEILAGNYLTLEDGITPLLSEDLQPLLY